MLNRQAEFNVACRVDPRVNSQCLLKLDLVVDNLDRIWFTRLVACNQTMGSVKQQLASMSPSEGTSCAKSLSCREQEGDQASLVSE